MEIKVSIEIILTKVKFRLEKKYLKAIQKLIKFILKENQLPHSDP